MTENKNSTAIPSSDRISRYTLYFSIFTASYKVKTIIRTSDKKDKVLNMLKNGEIHHFDILPFVESNFSQDKNDGYALHYVSFIHLKLTKNEMCCQLWKDPLVFPNSFK
ncbi:hypothetical protein [Chryseobacterium sp. SIMBA_029]|uniref:hypothetical protein n=1 Tax=Chryseobacterium sp. SIMBA_029 TaxID=3085772 RepID=UPI00397A35EC